MSPTLRRIRWRLIWTSVIALALSLGSFYLNQWVYPGSDDQCFWAVETYPTVENGKKVVRRRAIIREILPNGVAEDAGLLDGDELLMIQGKKVNPDRLGTETQAFINTQPEGRYLIYVVRRYDHEKKEYRILPLPVRMVKPFQLTPLIVLLSGFIAWALGLLVVVSSPQRKIARHFYYLGTLALLLSVGGFGANVPQSIQVPAAFVGSLWVALTPPLWLHFFLRFPYPFPLRTNRRFLVGLYGGFFCFGLFLSIPRLAGIYLGPEILNEFIRNLPFRWVRTAFGIIVPSAMVAGLVLFWVGSFKLEDRRRRGLLSALIFSTAILLDLLAFSYLQARAAGTSLMFQRESWIFFAPLPLLPLSFAYAILRHGFFDVQRALLRWVTYFFVLGLTLAVYLGGLAWVFSQSIQVVPPAWVGARVGVSALPIGWLLRWLLMTLRRVFRRDLNHTRELLLGSLRESRKGLAEDALLGGMKESLREAFRPQLLLVLPVEGRSITLPPVLNSDGEETAVELRQPRKLSLSAEVLRHARENQELVLGLGGDESDWISEQGAELRAHVDALEAQVMVLFMANQEPHTAILLGGKYAELNYSREDRELLREVALAAGTLLETGILHRRLLDQGRIEQELQTARKIQESLITFEAPSIPGYQMALRLEPAMETGGDLLWVKRRRHGKWIAAVGDVSGKGLAAALYMSQATALLKFATQNETLDFDQILPALDQTMRNLMGSRDFITLILLEWDESGVFRVARAGHPPALMVRGSRREDIQELSSVGRGLGLRPSSVSDWQIYEGKLEPGEWIVMYSDGLTEAMDKKGELFGLPRLADQLLRMRAMGSPRAACEAIFRDVAAFDCQNRDDRTLFILGRDT